MNFLVAAILGGLAQVMASMVGRVLVALSMSYVTYRGVHVATDSIVLMMKTSFGSIGGDIGGILQYLWLDKAMSMIVSAFAASLAVKMGQGALTKLVVKK
ncbi:DUF2523 family protein [Undibacterium oligocarboniphilum]|uniref:DUF2523 domain-containing protein n=1 Tax=Undibacterium oligocarboniphilum TaxID=666702 RepID=A0A850QG64_9BURK|nr:DUF2523 family protein [Undibacterium oligocarboniphilum]MBC3871914.1 DUF2523 domain-containing protein [Undibacterium oligocarboniphilum]NVO79502.1 DUF2523 domain-containing protein [Undibacterium oligocarboniphilum]